MSGLNVMLPAPYYTGNFNGLIYAIDEENNRVVALMEGGKKWLRSYCDISALTSEYYFTPLKPSIAQKAFVCGYKPEQYITRGRYVGEQ